MTRHLQIADVPASVVHLLRDAAAQHPELWAVRFEGERLRYAEYAGLVGAFAHELQDRVAAGSRVALLMQNSLDLAIATFAVHALRAQVVALNPAYGERELAAMLEDAEPCLVLVDDSARADAAALCPAPVARLGDGKTLLRLRGAPRALPEALPAHEDLATLQFTGGTTGRAKGVDILHRQLAFNLVQREAWLPTRRGQEVMLCAMPLFHVSAVAMCLHLSVFAAGELVIHRRFDARAAVDALSDEGITLMSGAPAIFHDLLQQSDLPRVARGSLRACYSGAAPLPARTLEQFERITGCPIHEGYGQSEGGPCLTYNPVHLPCKPGSVGLPVPGGEMRLLDSAGMEVPRGDIGEICVRGPHVMAGYRKRPDLTAEVLRAGWLHTGDLARLDEDGFVYIQGRLSEAINVGGFKVYPLEVEQTLRECEAVAECAAFAVPDERLGQVVHVWVTAATGHVPQPQALRDHCAARLAHYKVPRRIGVTQHLPRTGVGKLARNQLTPVGLGDMPAFATP
ncbi:class I adenylate-forming enzyme family protein [Hydrogenophaga sp. BPS33]|uniref:class I adenylate-forming enzyme family protein n=1 Tax=Hydrogenophaga sp. BPS33 TaxID=2651974 RepID=UPI00131FBD93|nr:AMP-binding protein [Hydrogenophaga sp. BPS33]QHE83414.1 long-chain fatty acid--CoA ligase [Hydrogenophaga sp. BPS33]